MGSIQFDGHLVPICPYSIIVASSEEAIILEQYTESSTGLLSTIDGKPAIIFVGTSGPTGAIINIPPTLIASQLAHAAHITCVMPSRHGEAWIDRTVQIIRP